jgi:hypothetical protein
MVECGGGLWYVRPLGRQADRPSSYSADMAGVGSGPS